MRYNNLNVSQKKELSFIVKHHLKQRKRGRMREMRLLVSFPSAAITLSEHFAHSLPSPLFVFVVVFIVVVVVACSVNSYLDSPALSPLAVMKNGHI